jgi:hypothetical protein
LSLISMRVLFAVFVVSLVALIWTLMALRRHVRDHDAQTGESLPLPAVPGEDSSEQND